MKVKKYNNRTKDYYRKLSVSMDGQYRRIIDLCGSQAISIKRLMEWGLIDARCDVTVIEKVTSHLEKIKSHLKGLGLKKLSYHKGMVETCPTDGEYDWVNLDTTSSYTPRLSSWLENLNVSEGGEVNVWLTNYRSNQQVMESLSRTFSSKPGRQVIHQLMRDCWDGRHELLDLVPSNKRHEASVTLAAIATSFPRFRFDVAPVQTYIQHVNRMYLFRLTNFRERPSPFPRLGEIWIDEEYEGEHYAANSAPLVGEATPIHELLIFVANASSHRHYLIRRMRQHISENTQAGKNATMTKAGWKSHISKIVSDEATRLRCHELIDQA